MLAKICAVEMEAVYNKIEPIMENDDDGVGGVARANETNRVTGCHDNWELEGL